ncbi:tyrosine-protein kinase transmembrane receptor ROR1-like isoform X1, partial [Biomphalaria glabrata]
AMRSKVNSFILLMYIVLPFSSLIGHVASQTPTSSNKFLNQDTDQGDLLDP